MSTEQTKQTQEIEQTKHHNLVLNDNTCFTGPIVTSLPIIPLVANRKEKSQASLEVVFDAYSDFISKSYLDYVVINHILDIRQKNINNYLNEQLILENNDMYWLHKAMIVVFENMKYILIPISNLGSNRLILETVVDSAITSCNAIVNACASHPQCDVYDETIRSQKIAIHLANMQAMRLILDFYEDTDDTDKLIECFKTTTDMLFTKANNILYTFQHDEHNDTLPTPTVN